MRTRIIFSLKNRGAALPFFHQHLFAEVIEHIFSDKKFDYHFSGLKGQTRISRKGLHYCSRYVTLVFACNSVTAVDRLLDVIFSRPRWKIGALELEPVRAEREQLPRFQEQMRYVCIAPLVPVRRHHEVGMLRAFLEPDQDVFSDYLYETTILRMEQSGRYSSEELASYYRFQVVPDKSYLDKMRSRDKKFARLYAIHAAGRAYEVRGYTFPLVLHADARVQEFVFLAGLGDFAEQGFGMLDLAHRDPSERTELYRSATNQGRESDQRLMPSSSS
ncbi:MAG: CRISPR-associated endoribonuclease Cas6 [Bernardetiaceae bacterium]